ncbi:hypothetical protein, partial [Streptomyces sp. NPDC060243]|uniref:hypothetical protein n=1 Tax=unclassified Streptomyces TaxID=2593676 RepID=UPI00364F303A
LYQILADPISSVLSGSRPGLSAFPFPFRRFRLYQILAVLIPCRLGLSSRPFPVRSDVLNSSGFSPRLIIEPTGKDLDSAKPSNALPWG